MHKIKYYFRKALDGYFSIEELFSTIANHLPAEFETEFYFARHNSKGLLSRLRITLEAARRQGDVNHITGDIHFITLLLNRKRTILTVHDCVPLVLSRGLARVVLKYFWFTLPTQQSAYVSVISEKTRQELITLVKVPPSKIVVIPNCVAPEFRPGPPTPWKAENIRFLHIGTSDNKNLPRLCHVLRDIPCTLEIIGRIREQQRKILDDFGINFENRYDLTREELVHRYQAADIVTFVSTYEGFGMPVVEAQACGTALVTSDLSPMKEVAGNGACLVNPTDTDDIRRGINRLIQDPGYRESVIRAGVENVRRYRPETVAKQYAALYRKVLLEAGEN